jgi:hypothetical protein
LRDIFEKLLPELNIYKFYRGWTDAKGEMSEGCDKIVFDTGIGVKVILKRK